MKRSPTLCLRCALLLIVPLVLAGSAWRVHQLQQPVVVVLQPKEIQYHEDGSFSSKTGEVPSFEELVARLITEARQHPYASSIGVGRTTPWPKEAGLDLHMSENLEWNRHDGTLSYTTDNYGWVYSHVETSGVDVLANSHLGETAVTLATKVENELRKHGWTLSEHYLP